MIINTAKATEAAGILGVELETLDPDKLTAAYRTKARDHHPDKAGDAYNPETWARVSWAKEVLQRWLASRVKEVAAAPAATGDCRACGGVGRVTVGGWALPGKKLLTMMCVMCNGNGSLPSERAKISGDD